MSQQGKSYSYIAKFSMAGTFAIGLEFIATFILNKYLNHPNAGILIPIMKSVGIWLIIGIFYYFFVYYFDLQTKFL